MPPQEQVAADSDMPEDLSTTDAAGVKDSGTEGGTDPTSGSVSLVDLPFPPEHYVATIAELELHEFPLPLAGPGGELVCPPGYTATRRKRGARFGTPLPNQQGWGNTGV